MCRVFTESRGKYPEIQPLRNEFYIDAGKMGKFFVTMKNISAYEMNLTEEMMERFVRGDRCTDRARP